MRRLFPAALLLAGALAGAQERTQPARYKSQGYRDLYSASYHIGKSAEENVAEYGNARRPGTPKSYDAAPGGHAFNRLDTKLTRELGQEVYRFLAKHLSRRGRRDDVHEVRA
jgi:hypothetical protein